MKNEFNKSLASIVVLFTLLVSAIQVTPAHAATLLVTNLYDSGAGSLRDTLASAASGDTIKFDSSLSGGAIHLTSTLTLSEDVTIDGSGLVVPISLNGMGSVRVLYVDTGKTVTLDSIVVTKGFADGSTNPEQVGGGIVNYGTLTLINCVVLDNFARSGGGGIYNYYTLAITNSVISSNSSPGGGGGILNLNTLTVTGSTFSGNSDTGGGGGGGIVNTNTLTVTNSTFSGNSTTEAGGGIFANGGTVLVLGSTFSDNSAQYGGGLSSLTGAAMSITNSTLSGNSAAVLGGGIYNADILILTNTTLSGNSAGGAGGVYNGNTLNYTNTIIANSTGGDCDNTLGTIGTNTNNLVEDASCAAGLAGDPNLDALGNNGGPTLTMAPLPGSATIDVGYTPTCSAAPVSNVDQRGVTRPASCDIGAYEYEPVFVVNNNSDIQDGTCDANCSLRDAIIAANADGAVNTIRFDNDYTIVLTSDMNLIGDPLTIDGSGHAIVINGDSNHVFNAIADLTIKNLTIQNAQYSYGGAINMDNHTLNVNHVTFNGNGASLYGGAIFTNGPANIQNSTFIANAALAGGGAIYNNGSLLTIANSTFSGNLTDSNGLGGGAIMNATTATIKNSTFSGNYASIGGSIYNIGTLNYANTLIANSTFGGDCYSSGTLGFNFNNLVEDGTCAATLSGDPNLVALANNGGSTQTFAIPANSSAINTGSNLFCALAPVSNHDQRGMLRPNSAACDIGAYEYQDTVAPVVTTFTVPARSPSVNIPITAFAASDAIGATDYLITETSTPPTVYNAGWITTAPVIYTVASVSSYTLYPWAKDATGNISAVHAPTSVTVDLTAPTVLSIVRAGANPSNLATVNFTVTFSKSVTGVDTTDFSLTTTGVTGALISGISGSGAVRTLSVNTGSGNGSIRLNGLANGSIHDVAGNALSGAFNSGQTYTIDKTVTLALSSIAAQDGWVLESSETSGVGGSMNTSATTFNVGDDAARKQYRGILSFSTAPIPDNATIGSVILKVKKSAIVGGGNPVSMFQGFMADIKKGIFGTSALQPADFQTIASSNYGVFAVTPVNNVYSINLSSGKPNINKLATNGGLTQIRLRFKLDDNGNAVANYLSLFSGNATNAADRPQLVITYVP